MNVNVMAAILLGVSAIVIGIVLVAASLDRRGG